MAPADHQPDETRHGSDGDLVHRIQSWYAQAAPPEGALERALAHVEDRRSRPSDLARRHPSKRWRPLLWPMLAAAAALLLLVRRNATPPASEPGQAFPSIGGVVDNANRRVVRFAVTLRVAANDVRLVGDFNGWESGGLVLRRNPSTGRWEGKAELPPGLHHYSYLVDGSRWVIDPGAPSAGDDLLGATNAIVVPESR